jgi:ligand-binding SRPBCC domain-containing protein
MPIFDHHFTVKAPLAKVAQWHHDPQVLKHLTPPPGIMRIHKFEPLSEDSVAEFTLWLGPLPVHWVALHTRVELLHGFTDIQVQGPFKAWAHTHTFVPEGDDLTLVYDHIEYEHRPSLQGLLTRLLFPRFAFNLLFAYRKMITRWLVEKKVPDLSDE